jgi:hypothetical protein
LSEIWRKNNKKLGYSGHCICVGSKYPIMDNGNMNCNTIGFEKRLICHIGGIHSHNHLKEFFLWKITIFTKLFVWIFANIDELFVWIFANIDELFVWIFAIFVFLPRKTLKSCIIQE